MAGFTVRIATRFTEQGFERDADPRRAFWQAIRNMEAIRDERGPGRPLSHQDDDTLEHLVVKNFGKNLAELIRQHFVRTWGGTEGRSISGEFRQPASDALRHLAMFTFRTRIIRYGSVELGITTAGLEHLVTFFGSNVDVFLHIAEMYAADAFASSVGVHPGDLDATVVPDAEFVGAFAAHPVTPMGGRVGDADRGRRFERAWRVANTSLVVPVVFALAVWYIALRSLADERAVVAAARSEVATREAASLEQAARRDAAALQQITRVEQSALEAAIDGACCCPPSSSSSRPAKRARAQAPPSRPPVDTQSTLPDTRAAEP
jgi:hypothetical protein